MKVHHYKGRTSLARIDVNFFSDTKRTVEFVVYLPLILDHEVDFELHIVVIFITWYDGQQA